MPAGAWRLCSHVARRRNVKLTQRDLELLEFAAEHRLVLRPQVQAWLGVSDGAAYSRLHALQAAGFLAGEQQLHRQASCHRITAKGLTAVGSGYRPPRAYLGSYHHDVGMAWLWLAARACTFGEMREVVSERRMRSEDRRAERDQPAWGIPRWGLGARGGERLHYPDLLLITPEGRRIAIELELKSKTPSHREAILSSYAADPRIDAVVYLVDRPAVGAGIQASARRVGVSARVHVQKVVWGATDGRARGRGPERVPRRAISSGVAGVARATGVAGATRASGVER